MLGNIRAITYRGLIKSCNYSCNYCPFAKGKSSAAELAVDKEFLEKFEHFIKQGLCKSLSILIVPYGEALLHTYYQETIARISNYTFIDCIGIQTNLSLDVKALIRLFEDMGAQMNRIRLWCTYHPSMISLEEFLEKIETIRFYLKVSVGVVGDPHMIEHIEELKKRLPDSIYLWVNCMDGIKKPYTNQEKERLRAVDPLFDLELKKYNCNPLLCDAGKKSLFVTAKGQCFPCNRNKYKLGNLYNDNLLETGNISNKASCDCYLSYSHRFDLPALANLGIGVLVRVPDFVKCQGLFVDVDGTLTKNGTISLEVKEAMERISAETPIFAVTMLPYAQVIKRCRSILHTFSGGVYAGGADIRDYRFQFKVVTPIKIQPKVSFPRKVFMYKQSEIIYKVTWLLPNNNVDTYNQELTELRENFGVTIERNIVSITDKSCSKLNGILQLCKLRSWNLNQVVTVGNGLADCDMLSYFPYSVAVPEALEDAKRAAFCCIPVTDLPAYLKIGEDRRFERKGDL